jgi:tetratricopeptide (TPR) repeat protein
MPTGNLSRSFAAPVIGILILAGAVIAGIVWAQGTPSVGSATAGGKLLADIQRFRARADTLSPEEVVRQWFELFGRAAAAAKGSESRDFDAIDPRTMAPVNERSLFAALPPPGAWSEFRAEAVKRTDASDATQRLLAVRYLSEVLVGDLEAARATLERISSQSADGAVIEARTILATLYGDATAQLAAFEAELERDADEYEILTVPDVVALTDEIRAEALLTRAVQSKRSLRLDSSEQTNRLARQVALANVGRMAMPQWGLAHSVEAYQLYAAMRRQFDDAAEDSDASPFQWSREEATQYYFLAMVIQGRQADAERALDLLHQDEINIRIPREAIEALQRAHMNERLYQFLDGLLTRRPGIPAWQLYFEQAAYTGHSEDALQRLESVLSRKDLPAGQRAQLQSWRFDALLAADRVDQAEASLREMFAPPADAHDRTRGRVDAAIKAMRAGRLLGRPGLAEAGESFARAVTELPDDSGPVGSAEARQALYEQLRASGRADEVLAMAKAHVGRKMETFQEAFMRRLGNDVGGDQESLVEMAAIHSDAGRHDQVLALLTTSPHWGAIDLTELMVANDSQGTPLPIFAARALAAKGDEAAALRIARAMVVALPGEDTGYELIARLDPDAIQSFDAMFGLDEFEERPLIWKASLQLENGAIDAAEATIRQAIAVDPSDGEEGPNDRMRAYAILSKILERKGNEADARLYASAVEAIRLSEQGDRLHAAGLYERAFDTYRQALEKFSDAYCIQSRLAVQLNKQGRRQEALAHYRRAYELMPDSFGRVESHCFGCESVFEGPEAQTLAERVFSDILRRSPGKPQAHYLLAYLREHQGRYAEALQPLRAAVSLDPKYLNAWKKLDGLARNTYIESGERDIARLKLLELDPMQRHASVDLTRVGDLRGLWLGAEKAGAIRERVASPKEGVYRLPASARLREEAESGASEELLLWRDFDSGHQQSMDPRGVLFEHVLVVNVVELAGAGDGYGYDAGPGRAVQLP